VLALFLSGESKSTIARALDLSPSAVSLIISNPTSRDLLERASRDNELEMSALLPLAVNALRRAMQAEDEDVALRGAKAYFYATGRAEAKNAEATTAEDVVARILEITSAGPMTIRYAERSTSTPGHLMLPEREED
jgi:hypothetical protein